MLYPLFSFRSWHEFTKKLSERNCKSGMPSVCVHKSTNQSAKPSGRETGDFLQEQSASYAWQRRKKRCRHWKKHGGQPEAQAANRIVIAANRPNLALVNLHKRFINMLFVWHKYIRQLVVYFPADFASQTPNYNGFRIAGGINEMPPARANRDHCAPANRAYAGILRAAPNVKGSFSPL